MKNPEIEVCIEQPATAKLAGLFNANRVELCSALDLGGLTPSFGLIEACRAIDGPEVYAMIRPRPGNFCYDSDEISIMKKDIIAAKKAGAHGVVFGCLLQNNTIDESSTSLLLDVARSHELGTTFHRAFDFVPDVETALLQLINIGINRILTSGTKAKAIDGVEVLKKLVSLSDGRIDIMAGSGINAGNVLEILETGVQAVHFTSKKPLETSDELNMGKQYIPDQEKIKKIIHAISK
ncbi:MAG: copper homeostasis protein CutC [Bacteroidetes bacterium]|nr:MAG: copper homeostasis protein CutC [Bacteroidota bacterium]